MAFTNFFGGAFFGGGFFGAGSSDVQPGGHGSGEGADAYAEPRRVYIDGKPYTVRSRQEYLGLVAKGKRTKAREQADEAIERSQTVAREALDARAPATAETATLLHALLEREAKKMPAMQEPFTFDVEPIPIELLMMIAPEL